MALRTLGFVIPVLVGSLSLACGTKGSGDDGGDETGGTGGSLPSTGGSSGGGAGGSGGGVAPMPVLLHGFEADTETFIFEIYTPDDTNYANIGMESTMAWDEGEGPDGTPGRLRLDMPFSAPNQLADIQLNMTAQDYTGKTLRAQVMIESGFSPDPSAPGGAYIFAKTGTEYIWGRGMTLNLPPTSIGTWVALAFTLDTPGASNAGFDKTQVLSFGIQFFSGMGSDVGPPAATVAYVDDFTIE